MVGSSNATLFMPDFTNIMYFKYSIWNIYLGVSNKARYLNTYYVNYPLPTRLKNELAVIAVNNAHNCDYPKCRHHPYCGRFLKYVQIRNSSSHSSCGSYRRNCGQELLLLFELSKIKQCDIYCIIPSSQSNFVKRYQGPENKKFPKIPTPHL